MPSPKLPLDVKAKFALLRGYRNSIKELTRKCDILEQELAIHFPSLAPVYKCPPEILVEIFQHYLEDNPRLIRRLRLVNKYWESVATNTPGLWTRIPIVVDTRNGNAEEVAKSICRRIKAGIRHSKGLLLDISLDLGNMVGPALWVSTKEHAFRSLLPKSVQSNWTLDSVDNYSVVVRDHYPLPWSHRHILDLFQGLKGPHNQAMERWRTLRIRLPFDRTEVLDNDIADEIKGSTTNLVQLTLQPYSANSFIHNTGLLSAFTNLSSLKKIYLPDIHIRQHPKARFIHQIEHLEFCCWSYADYDRLRDFKMLQTLVISSQIVHVASHVAEMELELPTLNAITFKNGTIIPTGIQVTCPSLQRLNILRDDPNDSYPCLFPDFDPPCVGAFLFPSVKEAKSQRDFLGRLFRRYRKTKHFVFSGFSSRVIGDYVSEMNADIKGSIAVETVRLVTGWEDEKLIEEWEI